MKKSNPLIRNLILCFVAILLNVTHLTAVPELSEAEAQRIGKLIWQNECAGTISGLTMWNQGEEFPSMGIGHFIWYPAGTTGPYQESFPDMIRFLRANGADAQIPDWLDENRGCPWPDRASFQRDFDGPKLKSLRKLFQSTVSLQARFAAQRFRHSLPKLLDHLPPSQRPEIQQKFNLIASHPQGLYALMDYVNFKGEGTNPKERYGEVGWGMLQVLQEMKPATTPEAAVNHFADAAIIVLNRRIEHSPPHRNESRWRAGWTNRCNTYRP